MKPMPIGIDDFKEVREGYYFVDKTFFLKQLIDGHSKVTLCTRPRRFGKTLTLSMVKYFFDRENGESNRHLFAGLMIEKAGEKYLKEQGKYPVIFLTLKECKYTYWDSAYRGLKLKIEEICDSLGYLLDSDKYIYIPSK